MDTKNVLFAVILSTVVLIFWGTFFEPPPTELNKNENKITKTEETYSPTIEEIEETKKISRNEAINSVERIKLENNNIKGSIAIEGGVIDDITFKNYNKSLKRE